MAKAITDEQFLRRYGSLRRRLIRRWETFWLGDAGPSRSWLLRYRLRTLVARQTWRLYRRDRQMALTEPPSCRTSTGQINWPPHSEWSMEKPVLREDSDGRVWGPKTRWHDECRNCGCTGCNHHTEWAPPCPKGWDPWGVRWYDYSREVEWHDRWP